MSDTRPVRTSENLDWQRLAESHQGDAAGGDSSRPARHGVDLDAIVDRLDCLRDFGFHAILFMRWTAWSVGHPGW